MAGLQHGAGDVYAAITDASDRNDCTHATSTPTVPTIVRPAAAKTVPATLLRTRGDVDDTFHWRSWKCHGTVKRATAPCASAQPLHVYTAVQV